MENREHLLVPEVCILHQIPHTIHRELMHDRFFIRCALQATQAACVCSWSPMTSPRSGANLKLVNLLSTPKSGTSKPILGSFAEGT
jgi:hypothetical protein